MGRNDVTAHGFRATFKTWASERTALQNEIVEAALVVGSKVERAYRRGDMFEKRRRLMQQRAIFCTPAPGAEQPRADAADGLTSNRSFTEGSNMSDETKLDPLWERTKAWADKNRTISGALVGGAAGTIVPGLGTVIGAIVGAGIGFASSKEKKDDRPS